MIRSSTKINAYFGGHMMNDVVRGLKFLLLRDSIPISDGISNDFGSYSVRLDSFSNLMLNCWVQKGHNYVPRSQGFSP